MFRILSISTATHSCRFRLHFSPIFTTACVERRLDDLASFHVTSGEQHFKPFVVLNEVVPCGIIPALPFVGLPVGAKITGPSWLSEVARPCCVFVPDGLWPVVEALFDDLSHVEALLFFLRLFLGHVQLPLGLESWGDGVLPTSVFSPQ